ncbi:MAG: hypothetical protein HYZ45_15135 [Burkholderiales bacterium]|nr:hypothetical protein [Burkholderiales bacterium]
MLNRISRLTLACFAALAVASFASTSYAANVTSDAKTTVKKKASKKSKAAPVLADENPDTKDATSTEFECEAGNKLTIYNHATDEQHVALRWKNKLAQLTRVDTSTGANRFENTRLGLVWIGIPAKGMLLDAKKGQQLANECKSAEQRAVPVEPVAPTAPATPAAAEPVKG